MAVFLYRQQSKFKQALSSTTNGYYSFVGCRQLSPNDMLALESLAETNTHQLTHTNTACRREALKAIERFFDRAEKDDVKADFSFSARIPLAIPNYQDIQQIFLIQQLLISYGDTPIFILVQDKLIFQLLTELFTKRSDIPHWTAVPGRSACLRFFRTLARTLFNRCPRRVQNDILIFTLAAQAPAEPKDAYFGDLVGILAEQRKTISVYLAAGYKIGLINTENFHPLEAFSSPCDVISSFVRSINPKIQHTDRQKSSSDIYHPIYNFLCHQEIRNGEYFMHRLVRLSFTKLVRYIQPKVLLYPFENRRWEKYLLQIAQIENVYCIGYQHSSITPRHLAFHIDLRTQSQTILPDKVITAGKFTADWLTTNAPILTGRLVRGASMRRVQESLMPPDTPGVLVAISSNRDEAWSLIKMVHVAAANTAIPFFIRTHPTIPVNDIFELFQWPDHVHLSQGSSLTADLKRVSMVAYSSSTVSLEGMLFGRLPIFIEIGNIPSGDPMPGEYPFKFSVQNGEELAACVNTISHVRQLELDSLRLKAANFANAYLQKPEIPTVNQIVETIFEAI